jgi:hypothetical protein
MKDTIVISITVVLCVLGLVILIAGVVVDEDNKHTAMFNRYPECMTAHDPYLCVHLKNNVEKYNNDK